MKFQISFVVAPEHLVKLADEILHTKLRCTTATRSDIRALTKAYIDEADELNRSAREAQANAPRIQIESRSPPEMIEKARRLRTVRLASEGMQENVRKIADSYVLIAEKNQQLFDEFKEKYRD